MLHSKAFLFVLLLPPSKFLELAHYFLFDLDWNFCKTFEFEIIKVPQGPSNPSVRGFPHF
jgi:hypothetical protein